MGLGALGVVAEVTLQCVPAHQLLEHTFVTTAKARRLRPAQRVRAFDLALKRGARFVFAANIWWRVVLMSVSREDPLAALRALSIVTGLRMIVR